MQRGRNTLYIDYRRKGADGEYDDERPALISYVVQSILAAVLVTVTLLLSQSIAGMMVLAAMASTAFVVFARPKSIEAKPRNVLGGHVLSILSAAVFCLVAPLLPFSETTQVLVLGGPAVALAMFLMSITDTEHAPAAGVALAMVAHVDGFYWVALVALLGGGAISLCGVVCKRWLSDLT